MIEAVVGNVDPPGLDGGAMTDASAVSDTGTPVDAHATPDAAETGRLPEIPVISAGIYNSCGVRTDGSIRCWGDNSAGQSDPPPGQDRAVMASHKMACALDLAGAIVCWGMLGSEPAWAPPGLFIDVSVNAASACAVSVAHQLVCWGEPVWDVENPPGPPPGQYARVAVGKDHACALRMDGTVTCWGRPDIDIDDVPSGEFASLMAGANFSCALRANGNVECWGSAAPSVSNQHTYTAISGNSRVLCVLRDDAKGGCVQAFILPYVEYGLILLTQSLLLQISAGHDHGCRITTDLEVLCWGANSYGQTDVPADFP